MSTFLRLRHRRFTPLLTSALALGLGLTTYLAPLEQAAAFCGFYVAGADAKLFNDATMVVMMRDGKRTVLAMQNNYQGPPENFAMVVPVPVVLGEDDVKTLSPEVFEHVDKLAAPRLVEYWEQDPCDPTAGIPRPSVSGRGAGGMMPDEMSAEPEDHGVTIEAEFTVGEYEIAILSASDSTGLDTWLRSNDYQIPAGSEPLLRPYVESGMKFFVAKVDVSKVEFVTGPQGKQRATLSPLRFHYDSETFALPIRLGLINAPAEGEGEGEEGGASGAQDLIVHILARNTRYQVANYANVPIPTNLDVKPAVADRFGQFYVSLFDHTLAKHPKAVVTEYAWSASSCDPCPQPPLDLKELVSLGADVLPAYAGKLDQGIIDSSLEWSVPSEFVLTRLHARYDASSLGEDLVFEEAPGIAGGREHLRDDGKIEQGSVPSSSNQFQARYIIRHGWEGEIACENPDRGRWGGPPGDPFGDKRPSVARELASVTRGASLGSFVTAEAQAILGVTEPAAGPDPSNTAEGGAKGEDRAEQAGPDATERSAAAEEKPAAAKEQEKDAAGGCRCSLETEHEGRGGLGSGFIALLALAGLRRRRT